MVLPLMSERRVLCLKSALRLERRADNLSATYLIRANPLLTYAQKPRTETEEKAYSSERAKEAVR